MLIRWARLGPKHSVWRPWWLLGLIEVVTHPWPRYRHFQMEYVAGLPEEPGFDAVPARMRLRLT